MRKYNYGGQDRQYTPELAEEIGRVISQKKLLPVVRTIDDLAGMSEKSGVTYASRCPRKPALHNGQLKLLLGEINYLNIMLPTTDAAAIVVYAGAAPCNKVWLLHEMYPNVKFVLVDPNEFVINMGTKTHFEELPEDIIYLRVNESQGPYAVKKRTFRAYDGSAVFVAKDSKDTRARINDAKYDMARYIVESKHRVFLINDYMDKDLAAKLNLSAAMDSATLRMYDVLGSDSRSRSGSDSGDSSLEPSIHFWSDIRRNDNDEFPGDKDIVCDSALQAVCAHYMGAKNYMMKYRMPYMRETDAEDMKKTIDHPDILEYEKIFSVSLYEEYFSGKGTFTYLPGDIYIQAFAGSNSSETRLIGRFEGKLLSRKIHGYDDSMFYYNNITRPYGRHETGRLDPKNGIDRCGDCALESAILLDYAKKKGPHIDIDKWITVIRHATKRGRLTAGHGRLFEPIDWKTVNILRAEAEKF